LSSNAILKAADVRALVDRAHEFLSCKLHIADWLGG
jgi:hypothetical protein